MQRVLGTGFWKAVRAQAKRAKVRKAAVAYVTRDLIGMRRGNVLIVDASAGRIRGGDTDAKVLRTLHRKGVAIYDCKALHAKVLLLDKVAVIGSGNMSRNSADDLLIEAGLITDHASTVSAVASFIEQLVQQSVQLDRRRIAELCKIRVIRRGGRRSVIRRTQIAKIAPLGMRTWLLGVTKMRREPPRAEQEMIDEAVKLLRPQLEDPDDEPSWIRWAGRSKFIQECKEGDSIMQIWRSATGKRPTSVLPLAPVLLRQPTKKWTRFYLGDEAVSGDEIPWGKFQRILRDVGFSGRIGPSSERLLEPDMADAIIRRWKAASKR